MIDATSLTFAAAKASWRRLVKKYHPDNPTGDEAKFREVQSAWDYLNENTHCFELCRAAA
jgi:curved DNA-binding protein CbpA